MMPSVTYRYFEADPEYDEPEQHRYVLDGTSARRANMVSLSTDQQGSTIRASFDNCAGYQETITEAASKLLAKQGFHDVAFRDTSSKLSISINTQNASADFSKFVEALSTEIELQGGASVRAVLNPEVAQEILQMERDRIAPAQAPAVEASEHDHGAPLLAQD